MVKQIGGGLAVRAILMFALTFFWLLGPAPVRAASAGSAAQSDLRLLRVLDSGSELLLGANMIMLSQMQISPGLDGEVLDHGRALMAAANDGLLAAMAGPDRLDGEPANHGDDPVDRYALTLAASLAQMADGLGKVELPAMAGDAATLHYFNLLINQGLAMAVEGARQIVAERSAGGPAAPEARALLERGRQVVIAVMGSRAMSAMHSRGAGKMPEMGLTHSLTAKALRVMDLLDNLTF